MNQKQTHIVDTIFVLVLFGLFAVSALFLIMAGAEIYGNTVDNMNTNYEIRTSTSYLSEKIRHGKKVELDDIDDTTVLVIYNYDDSSEYVTYLYYYDGYLRELVAKKDNDLGSSILMAGQKIIALSDMNIELSTDEVIKLTIENNDGNKSSLYMSIYD